MREFEVTDQGILIRAGAAAAFIAAFGPYRARGEKVILRAVGLESIPEDDSATLPLGRFLEAMRELQHQFGPSFMRRIGALAFDTAKLPPGLDSLEKVLATTNQAYNMNHVNAEGKIGGYQWTRDEGATRGVMFCDNPYPCAFDHGFFESIATRFEATGRVAHADGPCRAKGGDSCSYTIEW